MFSSRLRRARRGEFGPRLTLQFLEERVTPTTFVVSNLLDGPVTKAGDIPGSLRQAIFDANSSPGADVVDATGVSGTIVLAAGELLLTDEAVILGSGSSKLAIDAGGLSRCVQIKSNSNQLSTYYELTGLEITGGSVNDYGAGIYSLSPHVNLKLSDVTVTGNTSTKGGGGGIAWKGENIEILNSTITNNVSAGSGGGIYAASRPYSLTVSRCTIVGNYSNTVGLSGDGGGGVFAQRNTVVTDTLISGNQTGGGAGAGIYGFLSLTLSRCIVTQNTIRQISQYSLGNGAGIQANNSLFADYCTIADNINEASDGGGVSIWGGPSSISNCTISGNIASRQFAIGGGMLTKGSVTIQNSTISSNSAGRWGGGIFFFLTATNYLLPLPKLQCCTITANIAGAGGAGFYADNRIDLDNTIVADNFGPSTAPDIQSSNIVGAHDSLIGSLAGIPFVERSGNVLVGSAQLGPLNDNGGPTRTHLPNPASRVHNAGNINSEFGIDQRGQSRKIGNRLDIGAVESFDASPTAVMTIADISQPGATFFTLTVRYDDPDGLDIATIVDNSNVVRVTGPNAFEEFAQFVSIDDSAFGSSRVATYKVAAPGGTLDPLDYGNYSVTIQPNQIFDLTGQSISSSIESFFRVVIPWSFEVTNILDGTVSKAGDLPGSFRQAIFDANATGTAATILFSPSAFASPSVITMTAGAFKLSVATTVLGPGSNRLTLDANKTSGVIAITAPGPWIAMNLQGITITGGRSSSRGGVSSLGSSLTMVDCIVTGNTSLSNYPYSKSGAGVYSKGPLILENCVVTNNRAEGTHGGGVSTTGSTSMLTILNCVVDGNVARGNGGGIYTTGPGPVFIENTIVSNNAVQNGSQTVGDGGGLSLRGSSVTISGCSIVNNVASNQGGGTTITAGSVLIESSLVSGNKSNVVSSTSTNWNGGGGIRVNRTFDLNTIVKVQTSSIVGNIANSSGGGIFLDTDVTLILKDSTVANNSAGTNGGGVYFFQNGGLTIENSTISGNAANGQPSSAINGGGGVYFFGTPGPLGIAIRNSTISGNSTKAAGGGVVFVNASGTLNVHNSTITDNTAATNGGGIARISGSASISLTSSLVANNHHASTPDIYTTGKVTADHSLIGVTNGITMLTATASLTGTLAAPLDPLLAPLADNGGPTKTHVPLPGSPAINRGSNPLNLTYDQRGPGFPRQAGIAPDIGAFEFPLPPVVNAITIADGTAQRSMIRSLTVTFSEAVTFPFGTAAFQLQRTGPGGPTGLVNLEFTQVGNVVTLTFDDPVFAPTPGQSLIDGNYSLTLVSSKIQGAAGLLDGNGDGIPGGNVSTTFHRLFGDSNGDRKVSAIDFNAFRIAWATNNTTFDVNNDGIISAADYSQFRLRYGIVI